jgi:polyhydroxybutyrate depolymerase
MFTHHMSVDGYDRQFLVHLPASPPQTGPLPVVVMFHGTGATAEWTAEETGWPLHADKEGFVAVFPEGLPRDPETPRQFLGNPQSWNDGSGGAFREKRGPDDTTFVRAMLDFLEKHYAIDPRRIYFTGFSNGAGFTFHLASAMPDRVAAIAPVAGQCWEREPRLVRPVPTLFMIGDADPIVPLDGGPIVTPWGMKKVNPPVRISLEKWAAALGEQTVGHIVHDTPVAQTIEYGRNLVAILIHGMGHHWPRGKGTLSPRVWGPKVIGLNATEVIWRFFQSGTAGAW